MHSAREVNREVNRNRSSYTRRDVQRIFEVSSRQLLAWEKAGLIPIRQTYSFQDLGQLRVLCALRHDMSASTIRHSILAMKAVSGMSNPLVEACPVRSGTRLVFRHHGAVLDPISRQLLFDFDRTPDFARSVPAPDPTRLRAAAPATSLSIQDRFLSAVQAEEAGDKRHAIALYHEILDLDPDYAPASINLGTLYFHMRQYARAEEFYRRATASDPGYVLAYFDLGNVLDELGRLGEAIAAYSKAVELSPRYADAHYNLALAYERKGEHRAALRHWQAYVRIDNNGPWAEHARTQIRKLLSRENLAVVARASGFVPPRKGTAPLALVG